MDIHNNKISAAELRHLCVTAIENNLTFQQSSVEVFARCTGFRTPSNILALIIVARVRVLSEAAREIVGVLSSRNLLGPMTESDFNHILRSQTLDQFVDSFKPHIAPAKRKFFIGRKIMGVDCLAACHLN